MGTGGCNSPNPSARTAAVNANTPRIVQCQRMLIPSFFAVLRYCGEPAADAAGYRPHPAAHAAGSPAPVYGFLGRSIKSHIIAVVSSIADTRRRPSTVKVNAVTLP